MPSLAQMKHVVDVGKSHDAETTAEVLNQLYTKYSIGLHITPSQVLEMLQWADHTMYRYNKCVGEGVRPTHIFFKDEMYSPKHTSRPGSQSQPPATVGVLGAQKHDNTTNHETTPRDKDKPAMDEKHKPVTDKKIKHLTNAEDGWAIIDEDPDWDVIQVSSV